MHIILINKQNVRNLLYRRKKLSYKKRKLFEKQSYKLSQKRSGGKNLPGNRIQQECKVRTNNWRYLLASSASTFEPDPVPDVLLIS